jgi:hypothetical protein
MTSEEMERTMTFILEQQAQLTANVSQLSDKLDRTANGITSLLAIAEIHEREITSLGETTRATDERLNVLVGVVERLISEGGKK